MKKRNQLKNLCLNLANKYDIPYEIMDQIAVSYFDLIKKIIYDGKKYSSAEIGRFYAIPRKNRDVSNPFPPQLFFQNYKFKFQAVGKWAYRAGEISSKHLYEYCSRVLTYCPNHDRKWFNPESCMYIDRYTSPVPEKMLQWRKDNEEKKKKK